MLAVLGCAATVLAIHWGPPDFRTTPTVSAAIRQTLAADETFVIEYFTEFLESDRLGDQAEDGLFDSIRRKYRGRRIDLVIAIADPALRFAVRHRDQLFPDAPIVYSGGEIPPGIDRHAGRGVTAVMRATAKSETLRLALQLHPAADRAYVVAKSRDQQTTESVVRELQQFSPRIQLIYFEHDTVAELLAAVRAIPPHSVLLYIWFAQNDRGRVIDAVEVARLVAEASPVPVYGTNEDYLGLGVVGGVVRGTAETATRVAELALEILHGRRAQDIPIEDARLVPIFDWEQLARWDIAPARLPADADIRFKGPTAWETYRAYIVGAFVVMCAQLTLITALLTQRARRRRAETVVRAREATLRTSYERIRSLHGRLIRAQEAARAEIARELHDDVCQQLVGVSMAVASLKRSPGSLEDAQTQIALSKLEHSAVDMVDGVRRLSHDLHPATLRLVGLAVALRAHCVEVEERYDVQVACDAPGELGSIDEDIALCVFRIAQEALRNGAVHGNARRLAVSLARLDTGLELVVSDDGCGFDLEAARRDGRGLGLVSMEERAHAAAGEIDIITGHERGTTVWLRIPHGS